MNKLKWRSCNLITNESVSRPIGPQGPYGTLQILRYRPLLLGSIFYTIIHKNEHYFHSTQHSVSAHLIYNAFAALGFLPNFVV